MTDDPTKRSDLTEATQNPDSLARRVSSAARARNVPLATILTTVLVVVLAGFSIMLIWVLRTIVLYVLVATFIAVFLSPAVSALQRRGLGRGVASGVVFLIGALAFGGLAFLFGVPLANAVTHFAHQAPSLVKQAEHGRGAVGHLVKRLNLQHWVQTNAPKLSSYVASVSKPALSIGAGVLSTIVALFVIGVLSFYELLELPRIWRGILGMLPDAQAHRAARVASDASRSVSGYVFGNFVTSVIAGIIVFITLSILGVPFAPLLALWVALIDLLPLVGGLLAGVPTVLVAALHSPTAGIVMFIIFIVYQQIENHILNPIIMSKTVKMSPALVLLAALAGAVLGGKLHSGFGTLIGALIGIPVGSALQVVIKELHSPQRIESGEPEAPSSIA